MTKDHIKAWSQCLHIIKNQINNQSFKTWFQPIKPYRYQKDTLTIQLPSKFFYEWLEEHYLTLLRNAIKTILGENGKLEYIIKQEEEKPPTNILQHKKPTHSIYYELSSTQLTTQLNPNYTFENFIEGTSNQLTKSVAQAIAEKPGKTAFNPTIIYGAPGMGKTHILQAIIHAAQHNFKHQLTALYIPVEQFANQFIESVRNNSLPKFINYYANCHLLAIDDVQLLTGKEKTQEIFRTIFNHLHQSSKQIVMTSDSPPADLKGLEQRLLSRFKWGLTTDVKMPDFETRMAIIYNKLQQNNISVESSLVEYIAASIETNIRDIEGVVTSLIAHTALNNRPINYNLVRSTLENIITKTDIELSLEFLQETIAHHYEVSVSDLKGKSRKREIVIARQVAMYLIKEHTNLSLKEIGKQFGNKDHSTVIYAQKSVNTLLEMDRYFKTNFEKLQKLIKRKTPPI